MKLILPFVVVLFLVRCSTKENVTEDLSQYKIAYNVYHDTATGNYEIFSIDADGSNPKNISNTPGIEWVYYAYQDKLYFVSDRDTAYRNYFLYEMDADGNNVRKISDLRLEDSWMSSRQEGKEMVVAGRIGKKIRHQLFLVDIPSGEYKQLTTDTTAQFVDPCFSPDGNQIVFRYRSNKRNFKTEKAELWLMNADGSGLRQLTHYPESDTTAEWHDYHAGPPQWIKPDKITYGSRQNANYSVFATTLDGSVSMMTPDNTDELWHAWSPQGQWITLDMTDLKASNYNIYIMKGDGSDLKQLTTDWRTEQAPVFVLKRK
jgi:TolB protein